MAAFDYPRRARDAGGDELVRQWLDWRQPRLPLFGTRRAKRQTLAWPFPHPDGGWRTKPRSRRLRARAGLLPDEPLRSRAKLSLHQDKDEHDFGAPIVSVSLGLPAVFQFGGLQRSDRARRIPLAHGDVVVWGGPARLCFHGILPVKEGYHSLVGPHRINITLRKAL